MPLWMVAADVRRAGGFAPLLVVAKLLKKNGGQGRNRTADAGLFRAALYQLSYLAVGLRNWQYRKRALSCQIADKIRTSRQVFEPA